MIHFGHAPRLNKMASTVHNFLTNLVDRQRDVETKPPASGGGSNNICTRQFSSLQSYTIKNASVNR